MVEPDVLINGGRNTIIFEREDAIRSQIFKLFATNHSPNAQASTLHELLCCLPQVLAPKDLDYENIFRILIVQFIDAQSFDLRSIRKTCLHIAYLKYSRLSSGHCRPNLNKPEKR